jgi:hypothetical protein
MPLFLKEREQLKTAGPPHEFTHEFYILALKEGSRDTQWTG